jgi:hypothetical protein
MIISERLSIRIADLYFDEPKPPYENVDIFRYNQVSAPVRGATCTPFATIVLDLSASPEQLLSNTKRSSREKIRRAEREARAGRLRYEYSARGTSEWIARFTEHFDRCAAVKALPHASRFRLSILAHNHALDISFVTDSDGEILAASCAVLTPKRVRGLYTAASFRLTSDQTRRSLIGRANRYLFWRDCLRFKESGAELFDFGGYYPGNTDTEKLKINVFKEGFGGEVRREFNCEECVTLKGSLARWAIALRNSWVSRKHSEHNAEAANSQELIHGGRIPTQV